MLAQGLKLRAQAGPCRVKQVTLLHHAVEALQKLSDPAPPSKVTRWPLEGQRVPGGRGGGTHVELAYCRKPNSSRWPSGHRDCMTGKMPADVSGAAV